DVLDQARLKSRAEVVEEPASAELVVLHDAGRPLGVVRDDGAAGSERDQGSAHTGAGFRPPESTAAIASKLTVPVGFPSPSSTTTWVAPSVSISDNASRRLVSAGSVGSSPGCSGATPGSRSLSRHTRSRFRPRSAPTKLATKSSAGEARISSEVAYWTR